MARRIKEEDIEVVVVYSEGYEQRFTEACLKVLAEREKRKQLEEEGKRWSSIQ
jgi:hypothetical protein